MVVDCDVTSIDHLLAGGRADDAVGLATSIAYSGAGAGSIALLPWLQEQLNATLTWITSGAPLFRTAKPATPPQHLVSYFVLVDPAQEKLLLVEHKNAGLWLPGGGHIEPDEHPQATVRRELHEELGIAADFLFDEPLFLTVTKTVGATAGHTDVTFWYVLRGDSTQVLHFDDNEFHTIRCFA